MERFPVEGVVLIELAPVEDDRGAFIRTWCGDTFASFGIEFRPLQANTSTTRLKGTIRGMHFQRPPHEEWKLVRVSSGRILDVVTDLRPGSSSFRQSLTFELGETPASALLIPPGVAHGYQTLSDDVRVEYLMGGSGYAPEASDGFRHDDPLIGIEWPLPVTLVSDRDRSWPPLAGRGGAP